MEEWKTYRLGDFMEFNPKITLKKGTIARKITMDKIVPNCREVISDEFAPYDGGMKFVNGDTIMARITPCLENGKCAYISCLDEGEIAYGSTEYFVIRAKEGISDSMFVYYLTISPEIKNIAVKSMNGTSGRQRAQVDILMNYEKELPPLPLQRRISSLLSSLDAKIETNRRINARLEEMAQALFRSWFIDFTPFKQQEFVEDEYGRRPKGWEVVSLLDVATLFDSQRIPLSGMEREAMKERKYPYIGATCVMDYVDDYLFDGTYLLMGEDGSVAKENGLPYLQYVWGKFWLNNHAHIMQGKNGYSTEMLHCLLSQTTISEYVTGAVQAKLSQQNMRKIKVIKATDSIMKSFAEIIKPLYEKIKVCEQEISRLSSLRDTLLPKLMSGELIPEEITA